MVEPSLGCFSATAQTFQDGQLSFEQFIDINLRHFSGERHDEDAEGTDYSLARLSWLGSDMGRVSAAIKICILEPGFAVPPVELLRHILLACPSATFQALMSLDDSMHSKSGISVFSNPFLLQIILLVAINYKNNTLAKALANIGPPPPRCIFHFELCSLREYTPPHAINREVLAHLIRQGWAIPDQKAIIYAVQSPDASSGIELFRAIVGSGFDLSKNDYATSLPNLAAASGEPQMLQHILSHFSIRRPNDDLILTAVKSRSSGGADMLRYLMNQGISVNYYIPGSSWASSPTDPYDGYGDPRARAEAEYAAGFSGYRKGFDTALHLAAQNGNVEAVRVLLDRGAGKSMLDGVGRTPFQRAQQANREKVLDMLRE